MLPKPATCQGCPLLGDGKGFVPDAINADAIAVILAQNPGSNEETGDRIVGWAGKRQPVTESCSPTPLIGATGYELEHTYLPLAGLTRDQVSLHNIIKCRWQKPTVVKGKQTTKRTNELPPAAILNEAVAHCTQHHLVLPEKPKVVLAMGAEAWEWTQAPEYTGKDYSITNWRGFRGPKKLNDKDVFATLHLAEVLKDAKKRVMMRLDYKRFGRLIKGEWPKLIPPRLVLTSDMQFTEMGEAFDRAEQAGKFAVDTEYGIVTKALRIIGIGWYKPDDTIEGIQLDWMQSPVSSYVRHEFVNRLARLIKHCTTVSQNFKDAELPVLKKAFGFKYDRYFNIEDTMQMDGVLFSEQQHTLAFLASIRGEYDKLKHLQHVDEMLYNWGDVIETLVVECSLQDDMRSDPPSENVYRTQNLPMIPILAKREEAGLRVNEERVERGVTEYEAKLADAVGMAQAYCGREINMGSSGSEGQLVKYLRDYEGIDINSIDDDEVAQWRTHFAPFDATEEEKNGITVEYITKRIEQEGAHPLLEIRAMYAKDKQVLSHYLYPLRGKQRCYPTISLHSQATGRHSTTNPPLATLPSKLRDLVIPDLGHLWFGGDYDQEELRIFAAEAVDEVLLEAFRQKYDIHTITCCELFDLQFPPNLRDPHESLECAAWRAAVSWGLGADVVKDDVRRVFSKRFIYRLIYFALAHLAHTIPGAKALGLIDQAIDNAAIRYLSKHPAIPAYKRKITGIAEKVGFTRSWSGRRRVSYKTKDEKVRALGNQPMQGGGADLLNHTVIQVEREVPEVDYAYGMHDSFWFDIETGLFNNSIGKHIKDIAEQPRIINGMSVPFPMSMKVMDDTGKVSKWKEVA